jgi:hypothetical protein
MQLNSFANWPGRPDKLPFGTALAFIHQAIPIKATNAWLPPLQQGGNEKPPFALRFGRNPPARSARGYASQCRPGDHLINPLSFQ